MKRLCTVYKSTKKDETYLYTDRLEGLKRVPKELLEIFGTPKEVMALMLTEDKVLGRADAKTVLEDIENKGFFLQMPPPREDYLLDLDRDTSARYLDIS